MDNKVRTITYFAKPGKGNTGAVIEAVAARLEEGDIQTVVVASTTGYTALELARVLGQRFTIVSVSETPLVREWGHKYPVLPDETKAELEQLGVIVADRLPYLFHSSVLDYSEWKTPGPELIVRETLYAFGQGLKVAVEVVLLAVASGFIEPYQDVIAIGGTSRGADTAIVMNATFPNHFFSTDPKKRLRIKEILCKPI
ncbi:MAG: pyruvate kinase alpha/beta domain-containing protein [Anaerolineae bacterium]